AVGQAIDSAKNLTDATAAPLAWALSELLRTDEEVRQNLAALKSGMRPPMAWRAPPYQSNRIAVGDGIRASAPLSIASALFLRAGWLASHERSALLRSPRQRIRHRNTESARLYDDCSYRLADCGRSCRRIRILDPRWRLRLPVTGNWAGSIRCRSGAIDQRPESGTRVSGPDRSDFLHGNLLAEQSADL